MENKNVSLTNKAFAYVKHGIDITDEMKELYQNSMIVIGDEQQIYIPVLNTYVGIGKTSFDRFVNTGVWEQGEGEVSVQIRNSGAIAKGSYTTAEGKDTIAIGNFSHTEGQNTKVEGTHGHAEGKNTTVKGNYSHNEGEWTVSVGNHAHVEGFYSCAYGNNTHAEGDTTYAYGQNSHTEGRITSAYGQNSHAEGNDTTAYGNNTHSEGNTTYAIGENSHVEGLATYTYNSAEHAEGKYNLSVSGKTIHTTGIGTSNSDRKNAFEIHNDGLAYLINVKDHNGTIYNGTNSNSVASLQDIINRHVQTGTEDNSGIHVINNIHVDSTNGDISYTYTDLTGTETRSAATKDYVIGYTQTADGRISVQYGVFTNQEHDKGTTAQGHVITYTYIDNQGKLHADTRNLTGTETRSAATKDYVIGYTQTADGKVSIEYGVFTNQEHDKGTTAQGHVITYTYIDNEGKLHANTRDLSGTDSSDFLTSYTQTADGKISVGKGTFTYEGYDKGTTAQNHIITDLNISSTGKISYNYRDISGSDSSDFLIGFSQTKDGKVTVSKGVFSNTYLDDGKHNLVSYTSTNPLINVSYAYIDTTGHMHQTYNTLYVDPENDFKYHDLSITQSTYQGDANFGYAIIGISTSNGNATSHTVSYLTYGFPTKKYVDDLIKANDALRMCGTITGATSSGSIGTFTHNSNPGPAHRTTPDTDCGAVYKITSVGYFGTERVSPGDMIISYSDSAVTTSTTGWAVINQNIDLRQVNSNVENSDNSARVITNVHLTNDGELSYNYYDLSVQNDTITNVNNTNAAIPSNATAVNLLRNAATTTTGFPVLTNISLTQEGTKTHLSYSYTYIYTDRGHHSTNTGTNTKAGATPAYVSLSMIPTDVLTGVSISADGALSYSYTPIVVSDSAHAHGADQAILAYGLNNIYLSGSDTEGVITKLYVNPAVPDPYNAVPGYVTYTYNNLSGSERVNTTTYSTTQKDFVIGYTQKPAGKIGLDYGQFTTNPSSDTRYISDGTYDFVSYVWLGHDAKLTYKMTSVTITDSYVYNKERTDAGTVINLGGAINEGRTYSYYTKHAYTYIDSGSSYSYFTNERIANTLKVGGQTTLNNKLTVTTGGAEIIAGGLTVTAGGATITAGGLTVNGGATITGATSVVGTLNTSNTLTVSGGGANITGTTTITGNTSISGTTTSGNKLTVSSGGADITGDVVLNNNLHVKGDTTIDGDLVVNKTTILEKKLKVKTEGIEIVAGGLSVDAGGADITGNSTVRGTLTTTKKLTVQSEGVEITDGGLTIVEDGASITGDVSIAGTVTITGNTGITGNETITGNLAVTGDTTLGDIDTDNVTFNAKNINLTGNTSTTIKFTGLVKLWGTVS